uniref:Variant surface glycoprotein (VSG, atypical), putative n=1 Tax=Trypanosoma brucei brucei (strain 927/4 GUTat10.1) TaxID=185431 RepID=Q4FKR2_TRYB2|nr:variant surface glycoprotein (VSG, atypical), putative [Trypanosoma brucei brucei TREU927]
MTRRTTEVALLLLLNVAARSVQTPVYDTVGAKVSTVCEEAQYAYALAQKLEQRLEPLKISVAKLKNSALANAMAAAQTDDVQRKRGERALAALALSRYKTAALNLQTSQQKTLDATTALRTRAARVLAAASKHFTGSGTPRQAAKTDNGGRFDSGKVCTFKTTWTPAQPTPCDVTKLSGGKILLSETNPEGLKKLKLTPDTIFKLQIIELQAEAKGNMATDPTQGQSYGACINAGSTRTPKTSGVTAQATAVQEATAQTDVDIYKQEDNKERCEQLTGEADTDGPLTQKHLRSKLCEALGASVTAPKSPEDETLAALAADPQLLHILLALDGKDKPAASTATADLIKHALGPDDTAYESNFKKPVTTQQQSISIGGSQVTGTLLTITASADEPKTHAYLLGQEAKHALVAKSFSDQQSEATATQKQCDTHRDKTAEECTKLGCNHDAEKKKLKAKLGSDGAKAEGTEEKTTEKCKGKLEDVRTKDPGCKWENNACKNSSILVHKKLGLMAADFIILGAF